MEGINNVLARINEIQQKINHFRPERLAQFQQFNSNKTQFKDKLNETLQKETFNPTYSYDPVATEKVTPKVNPENKNIENSIVNKPLPEVKENEGIDSIIKEASKKYNVPEALIRSVIKTESAYNPKAVSRAGAKGLMQLMPQTAKSLNVENIFDPRENIFGGTKYLKSLLTHFDGNISLSAAAYNAGIGRVMRSGGVPNIKETKAYVQKVVNSYNQFKKEIK